MSLNEVPYEVDDFKVFVDRAQEKERDNKRAKREDLRGEVCAHDSRYRVQYGWLDFRNKDRYCHTKQAERCGIKDDKLSSVAANETGGLPKGT